MNSKHLSCVILAALTFALFQLTMVLRQRMNEAVNAAEDARARHETASNDRSIAQGFLDSARKTTAPHRKFLQMWEPELVRTGTEGGAKNEFGRLLKRFPSLNQFIFSNNWSAPAQNKEMKYVSRRYGSTLKLEADYQKTLQMLASVERDLPAGRISSLEIRKGLRANDVELDLFVEFPLLAPEALPAASAGTAQ